MKVLIVLFIVVTGSCSFPHKYSREDKPDDIARPNNVAITRAGTVDFDFQNGDLIFQDLDCGDLCDAIEKVTKGVDGKSFSHLGLVYFTDDGVFVIEASGSDVHLTPLESFVSRTKDENGNVKIVVGRLKKEFQGLSPAALQFAYSKIGTPYDDAFVYDNGKYYCSELIYDAYYTANGDRPFFELEPMTFNNPVTGRIFPSWKKYYAELKIPVPEGKLGCNPAGISRSERIEIVGSFY